MEERCGIIAGKNARDERSKVEMSENDIYLSKTQVRKLGVALRNGNYTNKDRQDIAAWRSAHTNIIRHMVNAINNKLKSHKMRTKFIARRLKRFSSIENKLKRFHNMELDRMQDIAGVRVVFDNVEETKKFAEILQDTYKTGNKRFVYKHSKDYIQTPKPDGYRSIHQVYEYQNESGFRYLIEVQLRSQLQHLWATAVEVFGIQTKSYIKQGEGNEIEREFFALCSQLISHQEKAFLSAAEKKKAKDKLVKLEKQHDFFGLLEGLNLSSRHIENLTNSSSHYFILEFNTKEKNIRIQGYQKKDVEKAHKYYAYLEEHELNSNTVLVALDDIKLLQKAYPNYYLDCRAFVRQIKSILE